MAHHRFIATVDVTVAVPNPGSAPALPADQALIDIIAQAMVGKVKLKHQGLDYTVETVKKK